MQTIGSSQPVLDATAKVTGKTKYVADLKFSQMLYAKVLFSPIAHGKIININTTETFKATIIPLTVALSLVPFINNKLINTIMKTAGKFIIPPAPSQGPLVIQTGR